jgi:phage shock protein PspC (stress-responsive transcriptional regulator)
MDLLTTDEPTRPDTAEGAPPGMGTDASTEPGTDTGTGPGAPEKPDDVEREAGAASDSPLAGPPLSGPPASGPPPAGPPEGPPPSAGGWDAPPPPPPADHPRRSLRRDVRRRVLGGVAAGLADYLDVDVAVVRVAFVVLAVLAGSGVLLYLAAWLLIPAGDDGRSVIHDLVEARPRRRSVLAVVLGTVIAVIAVSNLFSSGPWWPHWDHGFGGFGFFFGLVALVLAGVLVVASGRRDGSPLRWVLLTSVVTVLAVIVVAVATVFSVEALSGVPLRGGIGDVQWRPTAASQVAPTYRLAIGNMRLDLRDVPFRPGTTHVTASVGIGHLVVDLPPGPAVSVTAHSGMGDVQIFGTDNGGVSPSRTMEQPASTSGNSDARVVIDAQAGVGQVQVMRDGS